MGQALRGYLYTALQLLGLAFIDRDERRVAGGHDVVGEEMLAAGVSLAGLEKLRELRPEWRGGVLEEQAIGSSGHLEKNVVAQYLANGFTELGQP